MQLFTQYRNMKFMQLYILKHNSKLGYLILILNGMRIIVQCIMKMYANSLSMRKISHNES